MNRLIDKAGVLPIDAATPVLSYSPVTLDVPGRAMPELEVRVSAPATGDRLPVLLLSHGHGASLYLASLHGYAPLADFYAAHGFVVLQPTHLDARTLALRDGPGGPLFWRSRAEDMRGLIDRLDEIEEAVPGLGGRVDRGQIVAVGHSLGGHTVSLLAGMTLRDPGSGDVVDLSAPEVTAAVLFAPPGGPSDVSAFVTENYPALATADFSRMTTPSLVVVGEDDHNPHFSDREDWRSDAYTLSSGPTCLLTVAGAGHMFGGISGYDADETTDEDPDRLETVRRMSWAYLRTALDAGDPAWADAQRALAEQASSLGRVECK